MASLITLAVVLAYLIVSEPVTLLTFLWVLVIIAAVPTIFFVGYWRSTLSNARYYVENLVLKIEWGRLKHSIPLNNIKYLQQMDDGVKMVQIRGVTWPGFATGIGEFQDSQGTFQAKIYTTSLKSKGLFVKTENEVYLISPADPIDFITCVEALQTNGGTVTEQSSLEALVLPPSELWTDKFSQLLMAAPIILNLLLFGVLTAFISRFDEKVPLHFDSAGAVDRTGVAANLLILPIIGLVAWSLALAGGLYFYIWRDERPVAQIIWAMTVVIELTTWVALLILVT